MKKPFRIVALCLFLVALFSLSSCQKNEKLILGTWNLDEFTFGEQAIPMNYAGTMRITFKEDNTYVISCQINSLAASILGGAFEEMLGEYGEMLQLFGGGESALQSLVAMLDGMSGTYTIDEDNISMTLPLGSINGKIKTLEKTEFVASTTFGTMASTLNFTKI